MEDYNCPIGRVSCSGCNNLTTGGCLLKQNGVYSSNSIGEEEMADILGHKPLTFDQTKELNRQYRQHDWEALRNQAAISAMQGLIIADDGYTMSTPRLAKMAVQHADELIKKLKGDNT